MRSLKLVHRYMKFAMDATLILQSLPVWSLRAEIGLSTLEMVSLKI